MNILLIEDNLADQLLTEEAFKKAAGEHVLQCVDDGDKALIAIEELEQQQQLPDLILSDMNLPRKGGHEVLAELKESAALQNIPVIILSGSLSQREVDLSYELGACAHVCKPSSMAEYYSLASKIAEAWTPTAFLIEELGEPHSERFAQRA